MSSGETTQGTLGDPLTPLPPQQPAIKWAERYRATTLEVRRYSQFVVIMKRALPIAAAALLAAVIAYSMQPRLLNNKRVAMTFRDLSIVSNDLMMIKPKLTGVDSDGNPYVVTADQAIQDMHNGKRAQLQHVEADVTLRSGPWLNATAPHGFLDAAAQTLKLWGAVDVFSDNGYEAHTTAAAVDMKDGIITGNRAVSGLGPLGTFRADSFKIDRGFSRSMAHRTETMTGGKTNRTHVYLYGHVHMLILRKNTAHK